MISAIRGVSLAVGCDIVLTANADSVIVSAEMMIGGTKFRESVVMVDNITDRTVFDAAAEMARKLIGHKVDATTQEG